MEVWILAHQPLHQAFSPEASHDLTSFFYTFPTVIWHSFVRIFKLLQLFLSRTFQAGNDKTKRKLLHKLILQIIIYTFRALLQPPLYKRRKMDFQAPHTSIGQQQNARRNIQKNQNRHRINQTIDQSIKTQLGREIEETVLVTSSRSKKSSTVEMSGQIVEEQGSNVMCGKK